jgi:CDP-4-dehydro-6-deoxyglucose reductase
MKLLRLSYQDLSSGLSIDSCKFFPDLNLLVENDGLSPLSKVIHFSAKVNRIIYFTQEMLSLQLRLPNSVDLNFKPGQFISIFRNNEVRNYSIVSSMQKRFIDLIISKKAGGLFSKYFFDEIKNNDLIRCSGPKGTFIFRNLTGIKEIVFIATGSGIAPIKAIIESQEFEEFLQSNSNIKIKLIWGMKLDSDFFWAPQNLRIEFFKSVSRELNRNKRYVQDVLNEFNLNFTNLAVYASGNNNMISSVEEILINNGMDLNFFFTEKFN